MPAQWTAALGQEEPFRMRSSVTEKGRLRRFGEGPRKPDQELWLQARGLGGGRVGVGLDLSRFPLHEMGLAASARCWRVEWLRASRGRSHSRRCPESGGSSGPTCEVNFQQEAIDFSGPKN